MKDRTDIERTGSLNRHVSDMTLTPSFQDTDDGLSSEQLDKLAYAEKRHADALKLLSL